MDPVIGAAALGGVSQLFTQLMAQEAAAEQARLAREEEAKKRLAQAQRDQISIAGRMGESEQGAINQLMAALARTQR